MRQSTGFSDSQIPKFPNFQISKFALLFPSLDRNRGGRGQCGVPQAAGRNVYHGALAAHDGRRSARRPRGAADRGPPATAKNAAGGGARHPPPPDLLGAGARGGSGCGSTGFAPSLAGFGEPGVTGAASSAGCTGAICGSNWGCAAPVIGTVRATAGSFPGCEGDTGFGLTGPARRGADARAGSAFSALRGASASTFLPVTVASVSATGWEEDWVDAAGLTGADDVATAAGGATTASVKLWRGAPQAPPPPAPDHPPARRKNTRRSGGHDYE